MTINLVWPGKAAANAPLSAAPVFEESACFSSLSSTGVKNDGNLVFHGDCLDALVFLEEGYQGKIKLAYFDPPYNTGNSFAHYEDVVEHAEWLSFMRDRLKAAAKLMRPDGFICGHIDDSEGAYLKVLMDEVYGRENYLSTLYLRVRYPGKNIRQGMFFHKELEQIHVYRVSKKAIPNLDAAPPQLDKYKFQVHEKTPGKELELGGKRAILFGPSEFSLTEIEPSPSGLKEIWASGTILDLSSTGRFFRDYLDGRAAIDGHGVLYKVFGMGDDGLGYRYITGPRKAGASRGRYYQGIPLSSRHAKNKLAPIKNLHDFAGAFCNCRGEGDTDFRSGKKPEKLLEMLVQHFSSPGDIVLDAFAGSGTTGAVAHKMGRQWVMLEKGPQCLTHIVPRMTRVIKGLDQTGVTQQYNWCGGGGFKVLTPKL